MATTFADDGGLDLEAFASNLDWYAKSPLDGVVILGSNGESALLETDEKLRLIEAGVAAVDGRKMVMAGTGWNQPGPHDMTKRAAALGIDYALIVTPYYYKPKYDYAAYLAHYRAVADVSPVPILIYIMTAYTGVDLSTALVAELSGHPNIAGVKDSGGNAPKVAEMVARAAPGFGVLAGSASFLYPALCLGATGGIWRSETSPPDSGRSRPVSRLATTTGPYGFNNGRWRLMQPPPPVWDRGSQGGDGRGQAARGKPRAPLGPLNERDASEVRRILGEAEIGPVV